MPNPIVGVAAIGAGTGLIAANKSAKAAKQASSAQVDAANAGIDEQRRQFEAVQALLAPFVEGGTVAFTRMANLAGANGAGPQREALDLIENDPRLQFAESEAEEALLSAASATGGLRGGNTQAAISELRPALFSRAIDQTFSQLGGLAGMGQASAAGQATAAQRFGAGAAELLGSAGAAQAGGALTGADAFIRGLGGVSFNLGSLLGRASGNAGPFRDFDIPEDQTVFSQWGF